MSTDTLLNVIFTGLLSSGATAVLFVLNGGYRRQKQETENGLVKAIESAGKFLAESNEALRKDIKGMEANYEAKISGLEKKFQLKEKEYQLRIENLELENKNLKLENANLILENDRLMKDSNVRRMNG